MKLQSPENQQLKRHQCKSREQRRETTDFSSGDHVCFNFSGERITGQDDREQQMSHRDLKVFLHDTQPGYNGQD